MMKNKIFTSSLLLIGFTLLSTQVLAGDNTGTEADNFQKIFGALELPFLFVCIFFAFKTASALKGGVFGKGMTLMAWGFLVMAVGHLHMQIDHFFDYNLFNRLMGVTIGRIAWFIALVVTWTLSGLGFYNIYKASKG